MDSNFSEGIKAFVFLLRVNAGNPQVQYGLCIQWRQAALDVHEFPLSVLLDPVPQNICINIY